MSVEDGLLKLVELGIIPVLHHTPIQPEYAAEEDPDDPEPRWCCHDEKDSITHAHGFTMNEAVSDLVRIVERRKV